MPHVMVYLIEIGDRVKLFKFILISSVCLPFSYVFSWCRPTWIF